MTEEKEYIPKRGDIVQFVGGDGEIGIVLGWITADILHVRDIENKQAITGSFREGFNILLKKEEYENIVNDLSRTIELKDTEEETL